MSAEWDLLRGLFEGALERPTHERAAFLDEHTKNDPVLRREIESLLAAHESAGPFLSAPALGPPVDRSGSPPEAHRSASGHMRLATGTSLGVFTVVEPLGAGGMGEVYRARDTRLDRQVAIKVLSSERDTAPGARERFEREARAISRLSHPRICTIHDVGVAALDGSDVPYLVMELLDGETLGARIARGPLSIEQAIAYAIDIADALIAAHGHGIVHRDLKPANVMLTSTGVKLLDFGLAQLRLPEPAGLQAVPVSSVPGLTSGGLVMGTLPYTSPEQLRGEKADARTDIFAFGALLYEMLTGTRPFKADSQAGLIAAVLEHDAPAVSDRQPLTPAGLDRIVRKCLVKDPDERWQTARDLKSELIWELDGREGVRRPRSAGAPAGQWRRWRQLAMPVLLLATAAVLGGIAWRAGTRPAPPPRAAAHLSLNLPPGITLHVPWNGISFAIAPDGQRIAFIGARDGRFSLFIHTLDAGRTVEVPDTDGATSPMFSPDSQWVGFAHVNAFKKVPAAGGPAQQDPGTPANQMTWLSDNRIVRGGASGPIREIGDPPRPLTRLGEGEGSHNTPVVTPDGSLLFTILRGGFLSSLSSIAAWPPNASASREVMSNATSPHLVGSDAIVFAQGRTLFAAGFDSRALRVIGEARALGRQVQTTALSMAPMYAVARNGTLVYAKQAPGRRLVWIDRQGREEFVKADEKMYAQLRLSPDGKRVAIHVADADGDLWVLALDGSSVQRLTAGPAGGGMPAWTADGSEILFTSGGRTINRVRADRSTGPVPIFTVPRPERIFPMAITSDGKRLLTQWDVTSRFELRVLELGPPPTLTTLVGESGTEHNGRLSPNGRWLVYQSSESVGGRDGQIKVRPFPDVQAGLWTISPGAGRTPIWSHDGTEIFYRREDGTVMSASVSGDSTRTFAAGVPVRVVTPANVLREWGTNPNFDVSLDGQRFLFIKAPELDIRSLEVVLNWDLEVKDAIAASGARAR